MIFIVKDEHNEGRDISIAQHVMNVHTGGRAQDLLQGKFNRENEKVHSVCQIEMCPTSTAEASERLSSHFVSIRRRLQLNEAEMNERSSIPITR